MGLRREWLRPIMSLSCWFVSASTWWDFRFDGALAVMIPESADKESPGRRDGHDWTVPYGWGLLGARVARAPSCSCGSIVHSARPGPGSAARQSVDQ